MACTADHALHCFDVLAAQLERSGSQPAYAGDDGDEEFPLFVTWNTLRPGGSTRLRGCIGSFTPLPLSSGLAEYAIRAALKDRRFSPITLSELPKLECGVSLLTDFEDVDSPFDWEVGTHGIYIHFSDPSHLPPSAFEPPVVDSPASNSSGSTTDSSSAAANANSESNSSTLKSRLNSLSRTVKRRTGYGAAPETLSATYLPDVAPAQGWTKEETLDSAMRKAGYSGKITDAIRQTVRVTRYRSSKVSVSYSEWQETRTLSPN